MSDSETVRNAINSAWMHVFGSSFPNEKWAGGKPEINDERVVDELVNGVEALWQYAESEGLESVVEEEADEERIPKRRAAEQAVRDRIMNEEGRVDAAAFKNVHNEIGTVCDEIDDIVAVREDGF